MWLHIHVYKNWAVIRQLQWSVCVAITWYLPGCLFSDHSYSCVAIDGSPLRYNFWTTSSAPSSSSCHRAIATFLQEGAECSFTKQSATAFLICLLSYCCLSSRHLEDGIWSQPLAINKSIFCTLSKTVDRLSTVNDTSTEVCVCVCGHVHRRGQWEHQCNHQLSYCYTHNIPHSRHEFAVSCIIKEHNISTLHYMYTCHTHIYLGPSECIPLQL